ncbi:MAG TPA: M43 family zinc metalloprotease, partial [Chitinophagaceae bacterium]|nr:M43 family zinc metalloprotease [Chitinophagaceae bacterium]
MKAKLMIVMCALWYGIPALAQRNCGQQAMFRYLESQNPGTLQQIEQARQNAFLHLSESKMADRGLLKTTGETIIPVVFHIVLDSSQIKTLGGVEGVESRINTQMKVINDDFNGRNADKSKVPSVWTDLFANTGISFGLAHVSPSGTYTPGYEIRYVAKGTSFDAENGAKAAKFNTSGGLDAWDNTKYLNIWVTNLKITGSTALGITAPPGFAFSKPELGIALNYLSFGSRVNASQVFINNFDLGRTLTHELGHYFYLWHTWGDDDGTCAKDDGFSDTPLQADNSAGTPTFPR